MRHRTHSNTPGAAQIGLGVFLIAGAVAWGLIDADRNARWEHLQKHGKEVTAVLSDKHVIKSRVGGRAGDSGTPVTYHRLFFRPPADLDKDL